MFAELGKFWRDLMTENDAGTTYCPVRIAGLSGFVTHLGMQSWQTIVHGGFDAVAFGTGTAALIAAIGGAIGIKTKLGSDHA